MYKGKKDKNECANYRGISLVSVRIKLYGRLLRARVIKRTVSGMGEEQRGGWMI